MWKYICLLIKKILLLLISTLENVRQKKNIILGKNYLQSPRLGFLEAEPK